MDLKNGIFTIFILFFMILAIIVTPLIMKCNNLDKCEVVFNNTNNEVCTEIKPINVYKDTECIHNNLTGEIWCVQ